MPVNDLKVITCPICHNRKPKIYARPVEIISAPVAALITARHPDLPPQGMVCLDCLNRFRAEFVEDVIETEKGEVTRLEKAVLDSLKEQELLSRNINKEFDSELSVGERIADKVAEFGGSWRFIILFALVLFFWIGINSLWLLKRPFDPYPFILLNLVLSCLAALQAPIIMMSQNRQEAKDRLRAEHDYQVNLKAELEIRHLNIKLDQLISHQWERLLEIQRIQLELLEDMNDKRSGGEK